MPDPERRGAYTPIGWSVCVSANGATAAASHLNG